jgi:HSP20 family protein
MMEILAPWYPPFRNLEIVRGDIAALSSPLFGYWDGDGVPWRSVPVWYVPQLQTYRDENTYYLQVDLPGVDPQDIELTVQDSQLTLKAERKVEQEHKNGTRLPQQGRYGAFARTLRLPQGVTAEEVQAHSHNGVLKIRVSVPAAQRPTKVPVQSAGAQGQTRAS